MQAVAMLAAVLVLCSCTPQTQTEAGPDFGKLLGKWKSQEDTGFTLAFTRICCGSKPKIEGSLSRGESRADLGSPSYANLYPIVKPDSGSPVEYAFEIALATGLGSICAIDGFVQDAAGERALVRPVIPDSATLALTFSSRTAQGCDSSWTPMIFAPAP